jgi:galactitol-specific phosphotransferase system IIB component
VARVVAVASDLMLGSKVEETLKAAGHEVTLLASVQGASLEGVDLVVADLDAESPEALVGLGVSVLGYYSHVDVETRTAAEAAGVDLVVPRSRMARELPQLVERLLAGRD